MLVLNLLQYIDHLIRISFIRPKCDEVALIHSSNPELWKQLVVKEDDVVLTVCAKTSLTAKGNEKLVAPNLLVSLAALI